MKYPQSLFTQRITKKILNNNKNIIIDAPCGSGQTSYELAISFPNATVIGSDISTKNIKSAQKNYQQNNLKFHCQDIHSFVDGIEEFEVFCLINSLFLLPEPEDLLKKISTKLTDTGQLFLIIPNPESSNFKRYQEIFPDVNSFILERENYDSFFRKMGFKMFFCEGIARVPIFGRKDTKLLYPIRDTYLFWLEKHSKSEDYGYYLIELSRLNKE